MVYITTAHDTIALDAATCRPVWKHECKPKAYERFNTQRSAAIKDGKIVRGTPDGYLIALDLKNGALLWEKQIARSDDGYFISMPPLIWEDLVIIGCVRVRWHL